VVPPLDKILQSSILDVKGDFSLISCLEEVYMGLRKTESADSDPYGSSKNNTAGVKAFACANRPRNLTLTGSGLLSS
jgi:hypothetical protein